MEPKPTLRELFEQALQLPAAERPQWLDARCNDPATRAAVERMLAADTHGGAWLSTGDAARAADAIGDTEAVEPLPTGSRIGPFVLLEVLGEGGSATVFRAVREVEGVRQEVALKLLGRGLYTAEAQRRFHHEREALARLRHPGIARLIEGGVADNGLAYIALELVDGEPITRYAQRQRLSERPRLVLFLRVCRAVESAHRALIVHRDLKPSNVLVTTDGEVKLLDFGIAKLLDDTGDATRTRHHALTPAYAAPEQFTPGAITTSTDVYALGVLLRELLTGSRTSPGNDAGGMRGKAGPGAAKLRGDLANIATKATAEEAEQRYGSAGALAEDIERYLDRLPVHAHPPSRWYRAGKFLARHRGGVTITATLLLAIFASLTAALWQARVARHEAQRATAIRDYVVELLEQTAPDVPAAKRPDVPTLVYTAAKDLPQELQRQPEIRAQLLYILGNVLRDMSDFPRSEALLREANKSAARLPADSTIRVEARLGLARTLLRQGKADEAAATIAPLLVLPASRFPEDNPRSELLKFAMVVASVRADDKLALSLGREMMKAYRADCAAGKRCDELSHATHDFASILVNADRVAEARPLADEALALKRRDATPLSLANTIGLQSRLTLYRGDLDAADAYAQEEGALVDSLGNSLHRKPLEAWGQRIVVLLAKEEAEQVIPLIDDLIAQQRARKEPNCYILLSDLDYAKAQLLLGQLREAEANSARVIKDGADCRQASNAVIALARLTHGRTLAAMGDIAGAQADYAKAIAPRAKIRKEIVLSWPMYLAESMRLADAVGQSADATRDAHALLAALDHAEALPAHPWRLEAQLVLARISPDSAAATATRTPEFNAALASIRHWPVGARLARAQASLQDLH